MRKKTSLLLAVAASAAAGLCSEAYGQTFVDNFNNGNFANSDTIPNFFSSGKYSSGDTSTLTESAGGPLTLGYNGGFFSQGGPFMVSSVSNEFNFQNNAFAVTLTAAPGSSLIPNYDTSASQTAETYISLSTSTGRPDAGNYTGDYKIAVQVSNDNIPEIIVRDGNGKSQWNTNLYTASGQAALMPQGTTIGTSFQVTSMFLYVDGTQEASGHLFVNFGETWYNAANNTYGYYSLTDWKNYAGPLDLGLINPDNSGQNFGTTVIPDYMANWTGSSLGTEVLSGGSNFLGTANVMEGQVTDLNLFTWNNQGHAAAATGDGATWDTTSNNWVNLAHELNSTPTATYANSATSEAEFNDQNGGHYSVTLNTTVSAGEVLVSNNYGNYTISGSGAIIDSGQFTKSGANKLTLGVGLTTPNLTITGGGVSSTGATLTGSNMVIAPGTAGGSGPAITSAITVGALNIYGTSQLDITNNHIIVNYGSGTDPISSIAAMITTGYATGLWNGPGIVSSTALATPGYGIGFADSADAGNPAHLASGTLEIAYTLLGDTDLNGIVNGIDFGIVAANFNKGVTSWDQGDFDYSQIVNGIDFGDLAANFNKGVSGGAAGVSAGDWAALEAFAAANGLMADVPEPATIGLLAVGSIGILRRRRRHA